MKMFKTIIATGCAVLYAVGSLQAQPSITTNPLSQTNKVGGTVIFTAAATVSSGESNLVFEWFKEGSSTVLSTNLSYTNKAIVEADAGNYYFAATDSGGTSNSPSATLTVCVTPTISADPASTNISVGATKLLTVTAAGGGLQYAWTVNTKAVGGNSNSCPIDTSKAGVFTYKVKVSNMASTSGVTSKDAVVTVIGAPVISKDLTNTTVGFSSNYTFSVGCTNTLGLNYWYFSTNSDGSGTNITLLQSSTNKTCTVSSFDYTKAGGYWVVLSNMTGMVTSKVAAVTVLKVPSFTANISSTNGVVSGSTNTVSKGSTVYLSITPDGDSLGYYWMRDGKVFSTTATNELSVLGTNTTAVKYSVMLSNKVNKVTSSNITVVVVGPPKITTQPTKQDLTVGQNLNLLVKADGTAPYTNLVYQWVKNVTNSISGATNKTFAITNAALTDAGSYTVVITNYGGAITSAAAVVSFKADTNGPTITLTAPKSMPTNTSYTLVGTGKDNVKITNVWYAINDTDPTNFVAVTTTNQYTNWSADVTLAVGTNKVYLAGVDFSGNTNKTTNVIVCAPIYTVSFTTNDQTLGVITGNTNKLQWGTVYKVTAKPNARVIFTGWSGLSGIVTTNSTNSVVLSFKVTNDVVGVANFVTNRFFDVAGLYNGLFYGTNIDFATAGSIQVAVTTNLTYSGKVMVNGSQMALSGQLDGNGVVTTVLPGMTNFTLNFGITSSQQLTGTVYSIISSKTNISDLVADRSYFSKTNVATNFSGIYTVIIPPGDKGPATNGYGYGTVSVSTNGTLTFAGFANDGTAVSQSVAVSKDGSWPLFVPMLVTKATDTNKVSTTNYNGEIIGWMTFSTNGYATRVGPAGSIAVIKTAFTNGIYKVGFTNEVDVLSSPFTAPTTKSPKVLTNLVWGTVWFMGGELTNDIGNWMFMDKAGKAYVDDSTATLAFDKAGLISGAFASDSGKKYKYTGAVLQNSTNAFGMFTGTNSVGTVQVDAVSMDALSH